MMGMVDESGVWRSLVSCCSTEAGEEVRCPVCLEAVSF